MLKIVLLVMMTVVPFGGVALGGTATGCHCEYEGISGDYALIMTTYDLEDGESISSRKVGTYFAQMQCNNASLTAPACNSVRGGSQYCDCSYDAISGDYSLSRYICNESGDIVLSGEVAQYFGESQCTNAALSLPGCF